MNYYLEQVHKDRIEYFNDGNFNIGDDILKDEYLLSDIFDINLVIDILDYVKYNDISKLKKYKYDVLKNIFNNLMMFEYKIMCIIMDEDFKHFEDKLSYFYGDHDEHNWFYDSIKEKLLLLKQIFYMDINVTNNILKLCKSKYTTIKMINDNKYKYITIDSYKILFYYSKLSRGMNILNVLFKAKSPHDIPKKYYKDIEELEGDYRFPYLGSYSDTILKEKIIFEDV